MFNLGAPEMIFILLLALLIFGPKRLPQLGRTIGKALGEFRRATTDLQRSINLDLDEVDREAERQRPPGAVAEKVSDTPDPDPKTPESPDDEPTTSETGGDPSAGPPDGNRIEETPRASSSGAEPSSAS